ARCVCSDGAGASLRRPSANTQEGLLKGRSDPDAVARVCAGSRQRLRERKSMSLYLRKSQILAGAVLALLASAPWEAVAQNAPDTQATSQQRIPAWALSCSTPNAGAGALDCRIFLTLRRQETGQVLMVVTIRRPPDGAMTMSLTLPHGLYLPSGVS